MQDMQCHVTVPLLVARKQMNAEQAVNAMPCKYRVSSRWDMVRTVDLGNAKG